MLRKKSMMFWDSYILGLYTPIYVLSLLGYIL